MIDALVALLLAQASQPLLLCADDQSNCVASERSHPGEERLGPGPYTLVIFDGDRTTRFEYRSGPECQRARDEVRWQLVPLPQPNTIILSLPENRAICVPR